MANLYSKSIKFLSSLILLFLTLFILVSCSTQSNHTQLPKTSPLVKLDQSTSDSLTIDYGNPSFYGDLETSLISQDAHEEGAWSPVASWPLGAIHSVLAPDGKVLSYGTNAAGENGTGFIYDIWDPEKGLGLNAHEVLPVESPSNIFCSGQLVLPSGDILITGGNQDFGDIKMAGKNDVNFFDYRTGQLTRSPLTMLKGRWYPTLVTLSNGEQLIHGGIDDTPNRAPVITPEIYNPESGWRLLNGASNEEVYGDGRLGWWYPRSFLAPNGKVFVFVTGSNKLYYLDPEGSGSYELAGSVAQPGLFSAQGTAVMFDKGKILTLLGLEDAIVIDINTDKPVITDVPDLLSRRHWTDSTLLADGRVLVTGGASVDQSLEDATNYIEIFDPQRNEWTTGPSAEKARLYHSSAILLPNAAVLTTGGGPPGPVTNMNAEIYYPNYLFKQDGSGEFADRPQITDAPEVLTINQTQSIAVSEDIARVTLVGLGSATHSYDQGQRFLELEFSQEDDLLFVESPEAGVFAPPGYYLLFVFNEAGVPSEAKILQVRSAPVFEQPEDQLSLAGNEIELPLAVTDIYGERLSFTVEDLPNGLRVNEEKRVIEGTLIRTGAFSPSISVSNSLNMSAEVAFSWTVEPNPEIMPAVTVIPEQITRQDETVSLTVEATDPRDLTLSYSAVGLPDGLTINREGIIQGQPTRVGNYDVVLTVSNGTSLDTEMSFHWRIMPLVSLSLDTLIVEEGSKEEAVTLTARYLGGSNPKFKWSFGDGSQETEWLSGNTVSHHFLEAGRYEITLTATDDTEDELFITGTQLIHEAKDLVFVSQSSSIIVETIGTSQRIWNANPDNNSVTITNPSQLQEITEVTVGTSPRNLVQLEDGVWVTNKHSGTLSIIDSQDLVVIQTLDLGSASQPHGIAINQDYTHVFVVLEASGELISINAKTKQIEARVHLGNHPRHISILENTKAYVSRYITPALKGEHTIEPDTRSGGAEVLVIDLQSMQLLKTIELAYSHVTDTETMGGGLPNYLTGVALSPRAKSAWVASKLDNIARGDLRNQQNLSFEHTVRSVASPINLETELSSVEQRIDFDNAGIPSAAIFDKTGQFIFITLEGSREVVVLDSYSKRVVQRINTGFAPQGLAVSLNNKHLFVHNFTERTVSHFDIEGLTASQTAITLLSKTKVVSQEKLSEAVLEGQKLFYDAKDARLAKDNYISCASCHNDGGHDGRTWDFSDFGEGLRNTIPLRGRAGTGHGLLHWSGNFDEVQDFENQIRRHSLGLGLMTDSDFERLQDPLGQTKANSSKELDALAAYLESLNSFSPSPYTQINANSLAEQGKNVFHELECASCHSNDIFTDSPDKRLHDIGTLKASSGKRLNEELLGLDTPTLLGLWSTAPYLHDGSAATIQGAIAAHKEITTTAEQLEQLEAYLLELGGEAITHPKLVFTALASSDTNNFSFKLNSSANTQLQSLRFNYEGSSIPNLALELYQDVNADGVLDVSDSLLSSGLFENQKLRLDTQHLALNSNNETQFIVKLKSDKQVKHLGISFALLLSLSMFTVRRKRLIYLLLMLVLFLSACKTTSLPNIDTIQEPISISIYGVETSMQGELVTQGLPLMSEALTWGD